MSNQDNSNMTATAESLMGGSTRVQFSRSSGDTGQASDHTAAMLATSERVRTLDTRDTRLSVSVNAQSTATGGIIDGAMSSNGMPRHGSDITEDSIIQIEGIPLAIRDAIKMGLVSKNVNGTFSLGK